MTRELRQLRQTAASFSRQTTSISTWPAMHAA
jgi:hypothetical protein